MTGLSVLTLVKNRAAHLANLLEGFRRSDTPPDEVVIIDMDDEPAPLPNAPFPLRRLPLPGQGLALAQARNLAARQARFDHLLFLDVDCIPMRGLVAAMAEQLAAQDALICAEALYLGADDARGAWTENHLHKLAAAHPARTFPASGLAPLEHPGMFWSLAFGIRRATFIALGGFDEAFTGYGAEDTDFGFRAHRENVPLAYLGGAAHGIGAFHQHHDVFDPPVNHFSDIIRNAQLFHARWNFWPMQDWLKRFTNMGLIQITGAQINILRQPNPADFVPAKQ